MAAGGTLLMTGANVYSGLVRAIDTGLAARGDDLEVRLLAPAPTDVLTRLALSLSEVKAAEAWGSTLAAVELLDVRPGSMGTEGYPLLAPPANTGLLRLPVVEGRWLFPGEGGAVVVDRALLAREPNLKVGTKVVLLASGRRVVVRVVGVVEEVAEPTMYSTSTTLDTLLGRPGLAGTLRVVARTDAQDRVAAGIERVLVNNGQFPVFSMTRDVIRRAMTDHFLILLAVLTAAASASVVVGGLALATSMSMGVIERSREIGILRAIGATPGAVLRIVLS